LRLAFQEGDVDTTVDAARLEARATKIHTKYSGNMKATQVRIRRIGNSHGVVIPKPVVREGWAEAAKGIAEAGDDALVLGEFGNLADEDLVW
jgi:antitoxin MazE